MLVPDYGRVAVIDDDHNAAVGVRLVLEDAGLEASVVPGPFGSIGALVADVRSNNSAAVCDHRLQRRDFAPFYGAAAVAEFTQSGFPAVLLTQFISIDADVSIRRHRRWIPSLLSREQAEDPDALLAGLSVCVSELAGTYRASRRPWRSLVHALAVGTEDGSDVVDVRVPTWNPHVAVRLPADLIPPAIRPTQEQPEQIFFAQVNVGAESQEDLYFSEFEVSAGAADL